MSSVQGEFAERSSGNRWVRPSTPQDGPAIVALMQSAGLDPHTHPAHLQWKYWQARADWTGSRSFVLTDGRDLLAHAAVVPGALWYGGTRARVIHPIDWAARPNALGAGVALMKQIGRMSDFLLSIGDNEETSRIMPLIGYSRCGTVTGYVRALSPLGILKGPSAPSWKLASRVARSYLWSLSAPTAELAGWRVRQMGDTEVARLAEAFPKRSPNMALFERTPELVRHVLGCPIVAAELFVLERAGQTGGYFILTYAPGQARLADLWMNSEDPADWQALVHGAVRQAMSKGGLAELVAWSSDPQLSEVFEPCGFHARLTLPIYLRRSGEAPLPQEDMRVQMIDSDAFYLYFGQNELWA